MRILTETTGKIVDSEEQYIILLRELYPAFENAPVNEMLSAFDYPSIYPCVVIRAQNRHGIGKLHIVHFGDKVGTYIH